MSKTKFIILVSILLSLPLFAQRTRRPTVNLTATPSRLQVGSASTLKWSSTNATTCTASGAWSGTQATSGSLSVSPAVTKSYTLTCTGAGGTAQDSVTITVTAPKPTVTLTATPPQITAGASATLAWTSTNATTCTASGSWSGVKSTTGSASVSPATTRSYTLSCTGTGGTTQASATITVVAATPAPTVTLTANPTQVQSAASSTLTWSSTNATACTASGSWSGAKATSGSASVTPGATAPYTLTCTGTGGTAHATATVTVTAPPPPPTVTLTASPAQIQSGVSSTLTWSSANATTCTASGGWSGVQATSGSLSVSPTVSTSYSLTCSGSAGTTPASSTAIVTVTSVPQPTVTLTANPSQVQPGSGSTLTWTTTNASACTASGGWSGTQPTSGSASVSPTATTAYTLNCTGSGGAAQATATVTVSSGTTVSYWIYYGGQYNWPGDYSFAATPNYADTTGVPLSGTYDIAIANQQWGGFQPYAPGSSFDVSPYTYLTFALKPTQPNQVWSLAVLKAGATTANPSVNVAAYGPAPVVGQWGVYTVPLSALGISGSAVNVITIQDQSGLTSNEWYIDNLGFVPASGVTYPPTLTMSASPTLFTAPGNTTITWQSTNTTSCTASGGWTGVKAASGTATVPVNATNSYLLTCAGPGGSTSASASVTLTNPNAFSIQVSGNKLVNGAGQTVQLRGVNLSGLEFTAVAGWDPSDPTGGDFGQPNNPNWAAISAWKANVVRIPLNEDSWLGLTCTDTDGATRNADPDNNYKQTVANLVQEANAAGMYVILDLHWAAPGNSCPQLQSQMADSDHSLAFWSSIATTYKNNPAVLFELFNEPFLDFDFTGDAWQYLMFGTGGSFSGYPASSNNSTWKNILTPWNIASYQAMISAVRATGATNVVLIGAVAYTSDLSGWLSHKPTDPIGQMAATWHPYPSYGSTFGTAAWAQPNHSPQIFTEVQGILAAGIPVVATETGDQDTAGTVGAPLVNTITTFADANGVSVLGWTWDVWNSPDFVLIKDVNGTPTDGYGQFFQAWMVNHP